MLGDDLATIKSEIQAVKEFSNSMVSMQTDMSTLKSTVKDMEHSLSTCSDDITALQEKPHLMTASTSNVDADFLFLFFLIFNISEYREYDWPFGDSMCFLSSLVTVLNMFASTFLLISISLDRCLSTWVVIWSGPNEHS
ncbi:Chemokine-like receptor 1 [Anabarilius grahami]|uniref:Chemokine-like receptor 1 n=1 Tax=Anabarilius grahami TaxID=495550 RepID=A0A3N0YVE6_ANAGA|nr:Chemokine-like receptor 1 [Anabarilius grahami]